MSRNVLHAIEEEHALVFQGAKAHRGLYPRKL